MSAGVLVTDGSERAALAIVRSLGRAGHRTEVCSVEGASIAGASRYASAEHPVPDPLERPAAFRDRVAELCRQRSIDGLLPVSEPSLLALLPLVPELEREGVRMPFPPAGTFDAICDKALVMERAREAGVAVPAQRVLREPGMPDAASLPSFPLVVKPSRSVVAHEGRRLKTSVSHARDRATLAEALQRYPPEAYPLLLQERVRGTGEGCFLLVWDGRIVASFAHRRIREKPPTGGTSVYREAIALDPELRDRSSRLLESFGWRGVAMVEYKRAPGGGTPYLMEVNGRFWGSLQLAIDAGVDFPRLLVELALGGQPQPVQAWRTGVRSRWWLGDLDHLLLRLRDGVDEGALPPGSGGRIAATARFLTPWRPGDRSEVLRPTDLRPGLRELARWARRAP